MVVSPGWEGLRPGLRPMLSDSKMVSWPSTGMYCKTKPHGKNLSAAFPCLAIASLRKPRTFTRQSNDIERRNHESHWKHHLHHRRRIGYWPRIGRGATQTRKQGHHLR